MTNPETAARRGTGAWPYDTEPYRAHQRERFGVWGAGLIATAFIVTALLTTVIVMSRGVL
jgi:hypothetical protein